jgi:abortive infection bacteriophage resistance protein
VIPYTKPYLSYEQQVDLLAVRGLAIDDMTAAAEVLSQISYYRLSAYAIPFQKEKDQFVGGTRFGDVLQLYAMDEGLREAIDAVITPVEILLRTRFTHELARLLGPFGHYEEAHFKDLQMHADWVGGLDQEIQRSHETFIAHFRERYQEYPKLPIWMASEVMTLGRLSRLYKLLVNPHRKILAEPFEVQPRVLENWLHAITVLRNLCAHHGRLWNRELPIKPILPDKDNRWKGIALTNHRVAVYLPVLEWLLSKGRLPVDRLDAVRLKMQAIADLRADFGRAMGLPLDTPLRFFQA